MRAAIGGSREIYMKILIRVPFAQKKIDELRAYFDEIVLDPWTKTGERFYEDKMLETLLSVKPDALITELDRITEKVLTGYGGLAFIGDCRASPANVDIEACTRHKIPVICTPARNAQAVAEMLVGLLITYFRNIIPSVQWIKDGKWTTGTTPYYLWMGNELCGKKIGFVGFGAVGKSAAKILEAFGCDISFYDPYVDAAEQNYTKCDLDAIFANSDIVSIHLPVLDSTKGMIDARLFSEMKSSAVFVNTARSAVVDEKALKRVLREKKIRGAILDVLAQEPPGDEIPEFATFDNVLLTPHICGATYEVSDHQADIITERIIKWFRKEDLDRIVFNKSVLQKEG